MRQQTNCLIVDMIYEALMVWASRRGGCVLLFLLHSKKLPACPTARLGPNLQLLVHASPHPSRGVSRYLLKEHMMPLLLRMTGTSRDVIEANRDITAISFLTCETTLFFLIYVPFLGEMSSSKHCRSVANWTCHQHVFYGVYQSYKLCHGIFNLGYLKGEVAGVLRWMVEYYLHCVSRNYVVWWRTSETMVSKLQ